MPSCIVNGCTSSSKTKDPAPVLHAFPPEVDNVRMWLLQTEQDFGNVEELSKKIAEAPRGSYRMCSLHFGKECYEIRGRSFFLKKGAVPTIFPRRRLLGDVTDEEPHPSLKRSKRSGSLMLSEAEIAAKEHSYAGMDHLPFHERFFSSQPFGTCSMVDEDIIKVEVMPESPSNTPFEDVIPKLARRKKIKLSPPLKPFVPLSTDNPHLVHRSTNTDPYFGKSHKKNSANIRPKHFSTGVQCNLLKLPPPQDDTAQNQTLSSFNSLGLSGRIRKMVLHRGRVYVMLV